MIGAGVASALVLGLGFGLLTRPELVKEPATANRPMAAVTPSPAVPVEVAEALPGPPPPPSSGRLEVLPPDMAKAAAARVAVTTPTPAPPVSLPRVAEAAVAPPAVPASAREPEPFAPRSDPAFDCRYAGSQSERMVCGDPELARLDRRLNRAFDEAVAAGVPRRGLRQDQDDWLRIREDAARQAGPRAVASVYRQRIAELNDLAREASGPY